jgi:hypothetical protein
MVAVLHFMDSFATLIDKSHPLSDEAKIRSASTAANKERKK